MENKNITWIFVILAIVVIFGSNQYTGRESGIVCSDGSVVSDLEECFSIDITVELLPVQKPVPPDVNQGYIIAGAVLLIGAYLWYRKKKK